MDNLRVKVRILVLIAVTVLLILGTGALAQPGGQHTVPEGTTAGGNYRLTSLPWQVSGVASRDGYRLLGLAATVDYVESGCCCTYVPCILRRLK